MNLYLVERTEETGYATWDEDIAFVIATSSEEKARYTDPHGGVITGRTDMWYSWVAYDRLKYLKITLIGKAIEGIKEGVILYSNAGS